MEEILEAYRNVKKGIPSNTLMSYGSFNIHFSGNLVNLYDYTGEMPCGRYRLPIHEQDLINKLEEWDVKIGALSDNEQYICGKCAGTFALPEHKRDRFGALICGVCANGGDIREEGKKPKIEKSASDTKEKVDTPTPISASRLTTDEAIEFLRNQGYAVKKLVKSFKVVALTPKGDTFVTDEYYRSKEEYETSNPDFKFVAIVKELSETSEEPLD